MGYCEEDLEIEEFIDEYNFQNEFIIKNTSQSMIESFNDEDTVDLNEFKDAKESLDEDVDVDTDNPVLSIIPDNITPSKSNNLSNLTINNHALKRKLVEQANLENKPRAVRKRIRTSIDHALIHAKEHPHNNQFYAIYHTLICNECESVSKPHPTVIFENEYYEHIRDSNCWKKERQRKQQQQLDEQKQWLKDFTIDDVLFSDDKKNIVFIGGQAISDINAKTILTFARANLKIPVPANQTNRGDRIKAICNHFCDPVKGTVSTNPGLFINYFS